MYKNNFDMSSTGVNIEARAYFDCFASRLDFDDTITRINNKLFFSTHWGNLPKPEQIGDIFQIIKGTTKKQLAEAVDFWTYKMSKQEIIDDILSASLDKLDDYSEVLRLKPDFEIINTVGYSQGDFARVIVKKGTTDEETIQHLFWDCPVYACFTINGRDFDYIDYDLARYDWQREEFAEATARDSGVDKQTLLAMLPEILDYV